MCARTCVCVFMCVCVRTIYQGRGSIERVAGVKTCQREITRPTDGIVLDKD